MYIKWDNLQYRKNFSVHQFRNKSPSRTAQVGVGDFFIWAFLDNEKAATYCSHKFEWGKE